MSRHFKNIGEYDLVAFSDSGSSYVYLGELPANSENDFNAVARFGIKESIAKQFSNFFIDYTVNSSAFSTSATNHCPTWRTHTYNGDSYVLMSQYFGTRTTADYVVVNPHYVTNGNATITCNIPHATCVITSDTWFIPSTSYPVTSGIFSLTEQPFLLQVSTDTDYMFGSGTITVTDGTTTVTRSTSDGDTQASNIRFTVTVTTGIDNLTILSDVSPYTNNISVSIESPNASVTYTPTSVTRNDSVTFNVLPNTGYEITNAYLRYTDTVGGLDTLYFTIADDKLSATYTFDTSQMAKSATQIFIYVTTQLSANVPTTSIKFIDVYKLSGDNLVELSSKRWYIADSTNPQNVVDLAYYISSIKKFYCNIPTSGTGNIALAWFDTGISADIVSSDFTSIDCGTLTIDNPNNNNNDFTNTEIQILLPFIGIQTLDPYKIIGNSVHLYYKVSTITGDCIAVIECNDIIIYSFTGNISENIPYVLNNVQWQLKGAIEVNSTVLYGFTPILTVFYHDNYNDNNTILLNDEKYTLLSDLTDLNYVDDVVITDSSIPENVSNEIERVLNNGVIF